MATKNKMSSEAWKKIKEEGKKQRAVIYAAVPKNRIGREDRRKMEKIQRRESKNATI